MTKQLFLSYAREDRAFVVPFAAVLERRGFTVWWDRSIAPGTAYHETIERELSAADWVIVLWSRSSVGSSWVLDEASRAGDRRVLIPAILDDTPPPLGFGRLQVVDLRTWNGDAQHPGFRALEARLVSCAKISPDAGDPNPQPSHSAPAGVTVHHGSSAQSTAPALAPSSARRPKIWHCIYCGKLVPEYNDYWCIHCDSLRPYFPDTATMRQCRQCSECNLLRATFCEWCGSLLT